MKETRLKKFIQQSDKIAVNIIQYPGTKLVSILLFLGDKRRLFPDAFKKSLIYVLCPVVGGIVAYCGLKNTTQPPYWPDWLENNHITYVAARSFFVSLICGFFAFVICRAILPLLFYAPHAMSMRSMGLLEASVRKDGMDSTIRKTLRWHDEKTPIKIICISGHKLFGLDGPLYQEAVNGRLEVLAPRSNENNPTINARFASYCEEFKTDSYRTKMDLINEMNRSKEALKKNARNKLFEHDELCMWRVVLLSNHCIVQAYFPNHDGCHSDSAPVFVYLKETECPYSYYETYSNMFELLKGNNSA